VSVKCCPIRLSEKAIMVITFHASLRGFAVGRSQRLRMPGNSKE
jgi:hypothetical protein